MQAIHTTRPLRIAHVSATFPPYKGGTGNVCYYNTLQLTTLGHEVHVFTAAVPSAPDEENIAGINVHRLRPLVQIGNAPLLPSLVKALKSFDLIHLHYPFILGAEMVRAASLLYGIPFVISFHNDLLGEGTRARLFSTYQKVSARTTVRSAALLCAVSSDHYRHSILWHSLQPSRPPYVELPNGVDSNIFFPGSPGAAYQLRDRHAIPREAPLILFVAALDRAHHFKGLDRLLDAFAAASDLTPQDMLGNHAPRLLVVGDGDLRARYEAKSRDLGLVGRVIFAGGAAHAETAPYFSAADVTVLPSSPPESFGLVLVESMACSTPVIASDIPGVRTVVQHGVDGLLVEHANTGALAGALRAIMSMSPEERRAMGAAGMRKVQERYAWPRIGLQLQEIYINLLRAHRTQAVRRDIAGRRAKQRA